MDTETFAGMCLRIALRYDTAMSRAMLRACGYQGPWPLRDHARNGVWLRNGFAPDEVLWCPGSALPDRREVLECFRNYGSPMDGGAW